MGAVIYGFEDVGLTFAYARTWVWVDASNMGAVYSRDGIIIQLGYDLGTRFGTAVTTARRRRK